jgi:hypothetical protein
MATVTRNTKKKSLNGIKLPDLKPKSTLISTTKAWLGGSYL